MRETIATVLSALLVAGAFSAGVAAQETAGQSEQKTAAATSKAAPSEDPAAASSGESSKAPAKSGGSSPASGDSEGKLYTVDDGNKVDDKTLAGWQTWRAPACERCHGAEQEGLVGPALVDSMKKLSKEEFHTTLMNGRIEKGMPPFNTSKMVNENWEGLYAYLKGRSDGKIKPGRLTAIDK